MFLQWARIIRSSLESKTSFDRECEPHLSQQQSYHKSSKTDQAVRMIDPHKQNLSNTVSVEAESTKLQKSRENISLSSATLIPPSFKFSLCRKSTTFDPASVWSFFPASLGSPGNVPDPVE